LAAWVAALFPARELLSLEPRAGAIPQRLPSPHAPWAAPRANAQDQGTGSGRGVQTSSRESKAKRYPELFPWLNNTVTASELGNGNSSIKPWGFGLTTHFPKKSCFSERGYTHFVLTHAAVGFAI